MATRATSGVAIAAYYALTWFVAGRGCLVAAGAVPAFWPSASGMFVAARGALAWAVGAFAWPTSFKASGVYALAIILLLPVFQYCFQFRALPSIRDLGVLLYGQGLNMQFAQGLAVVWVVLYGVANALAFTLGSSENTKFVACGVGFVLVPVSYTHLTLPTNREV